MISLKILESCKSLIDALPLQMQELTLSFCTDNRKYEHPSCFVAIPGSKVNPLDMIEPQLKQGIPLVVFEKNEVNDQKIINYKKKYPDTIFLSVTDSVLFLQEVSHLHIKDWKEKSDRNIVFAISGSNGKTTHKEMLSHILKTIRPGKIVCTEKNNNNHLGVPLTLLNVSQKTEVVVLELGSNHPGEIKVLCDIAAPNAGLTTNIGATHLEFFGSEKEVFLEEGYLFHAVNNFTDGKGLYLINTDDKFLKTFHPFKGAITYGTTPEAMAQIIYKECETQIEFKNKKISVRNESVTGKHNKLNLITSAFIAFNLYPDLSNEIEAAASTFKPTKNRSEWIQVDSAKIFLDAYNANPSSMKVSLDGFKEYLIENDSSLDDACVVLGDMNELGSHSSEYHADVGLFVKQLGFKNVYFVGRFAQDYLRGYPEAQGRESAASFKDEFKNLQLKKYHFHFIKGSRSLQLESLFDIT